MSVSITDLVALGAAPASGDMLVLVDISDPTQSPEGSTKRMTTANLFTAPTFTTSVTVTGTLGVSGNVAVNTDKFTVAASTGNTVVAGTLGVTGAATFSSGVSMASDTSSKLTLGRFSAGFPYSFFLLGTGSTAFKWQNTIGGEMAALTEAGALSLQSFLTAAGGLVATAGGLVVGGGGASITGNALFSAGITSTGATGSGIGYATGAGGTVTQATNRTTGVTLNTLSGAITTNNASLAAEAAAAFVVTNSAVAIGDTVIVSQRSGSNGGDTSVYVSGVAAGSFTITVANNNPGGGGAETGAIVINYAVIKAVSA